MKQNNSISRTIFIKLFSVTLIFILNQYLYAQTTSVTTSETTVASTPVVVSQTNAVSTVAVVKESEAAFSPTVKTFGEFKYRYQNTSEVNKQDRRINRLAFKFGQTFKVQPDLNVTYRLMTGSSPTSGNLSLGDSKTPGAPRQSIGLDQAFIQYDYDAELKFILGKGPQIFYYAGKNQLILDRDIALEGFSLQYTMNDFFVDEIKPQINLGTYWVREKYDDTYGKDKTDSFLNVAQINFKIEATKTLSFILNYGLFSYTGIKNDTYTSFISGASSSRGNTLDILNNYANEYEIEQTSFEVKNKFEKFDLSLFAEFIKNKAADSENKAYYYGLLATYKKLSLQWAQQRLQSDSVFALYTDGDFADQSTNSIGQVLNFSYKVNKNLSWGLSQITSKKDYNTISPSKFNRTMIDLVVSF